MVTTKIEMQAIERYSRIERAKIDKVILKNMNRKMPDTKPDKVEIQHIVVTIPNKGLSVYSVQSVFDIKNIFSQLYKADKKYVQSHIIRLKNELEYTKIVYTGKTYKIYTSLSNEELTSLIDIFNNLSKEFIKNRLIDDKFVISKINAKYIEIKDIEKY